MKILLSGAGITTNALASLLTHQGHKLTILERAPCLRATGLQIDLRGPGIEVLHRMGLAETLRKKTIREEGIQVVDQSGRRRGWFPVSRADDTKKDKGKGKTSLTTEWEIMRGDLCRVLYDSALSTASGMGRGEMEREGKGQVEYRFSTSIQALKEDANGVDVQFSTGQQERFDLVIGGDGQNSKVRELLLAQTRSQDLDQGEGGDPFKPLGVYAGLFTTSWPLPTPDTTPSSPPSQLSNQMNTQDNKLIGTVYLSTSRRAIFLRRHRPDRVQVYLFARSDSPAFADLRRGHMHPAQEKALMMDHFQDAGWEAPRLMRALEEAEDFYCERIGWVRLGGWSRGRIVLVGDAAYAPSVTTGMGTTAGVVGAYVLAGEIGRYCSPKSSSRAESEAETRSGSGSEAIQTAVREYERKLRPFIDYIQKDLSEGSSAWDRLPRTRFGVGVWNVMVGVSSWLRLDEFGSWVKEDKGEESWKLPDYEVDNSD
ncbi:FAD/NAD(P)-binding domain-containing protein [Aspergillus steynii IBT 23096]|uniref:FAD/NAD(P)-binding domain-containing protein n=1 Tax=Aspergillus steynii IBT 23096 TaxID=1392250 RepID=A0A2I2GBS4_9EURO|nr:FAD/NAD(P)-binding domain-containing protein [Aspergillus steynii IBT 23096]PLB50334.1 FAD/NAD(P)-binding domain-containing protein [Aspergillus steynii IBT 23096]